MKTIKSLKKEAKELRKNNPEIKNQGESLNIIAKKYGKSCWQDILNASVFIEEPTIEKEFKDFQYSNNTLIRFYELISRTLIIKRNYIRTIRSNYLGKNIDSVYLDKSIKAIEYLSDDLHNISYLMNIKNSSKEDVLNNLDHHIELLKISKSNLDILIFNEWIELFKRMKEELVSY